MVTNFHLPYSTQLMMVAAFGGYETIMNAYKIAKEEGTDSALTATRCSFFKIFSLSLHNRPRKIKYSNHGK